VSGIKIFTVADTGKKLVLDFFHIFKAGFIFASMARSWVLPFQHTFD